MKKAVWISFFVALAVVNVAAEAADYFTGVRIDMIFRLALILGITVITAIFAGSIMLVGKLEGEKPLSGSVSDTLGADRRDPR